MRKTLAAVLLALTAPTALAAKLSEDPGVAARLQVFDAWLSARVQERELPSVAIGIVHDGEVLFAKGYGFADVGKKTPATPKTGYRIGSITKQFTATAILQLRDAGKLQLDDPVVKHLPWFTPKSTHPDSPVITIRHLLSHTSGLPRESAAAWYWNDLAFPSRDEMVAALAKQETVFPAETKFKYSNLALAIAGEVVATVSGEPWDRYLAKHVLAPLGMNATVPLPGRETPGLAVGYGTRRPGRPRAVSGFVDLKALAPCGDMASSVEDMLRWLTFQMTDGANAVLKPSSVREMHRVQWLRSWKGGYGLGFGVRHVDEETRYGHTGAVNGFKSALEVSPDSKLAIVVLTNEDDGHPVEIRDMAFKMVEPAVKRTIASPEPKPVPAGWQRFVGTYEWEGYEVSVMHLDGELAIVDTTDDDPWEERVRLEPVSATSFRMTTGGTEGEPVVFELDEKGAVKRMTVGDSYYVPKR
jgi:CubicO group peptidase (beta-lactamase class C family)